MGHRAIQRNWWTVGGGIILATIGCDQGPRRYSIGGAVTFDGEPVMQGTIGFVPSEVGPATTVGGDIRDGRYEIPAAEGPLSGTYQVVIYAERPTGRRIQADEGSPETVAEIEQFIPGIYNITSTLTARIDSDRGDLDFALQPAPSNGRRRRR